MKVVVCVKRVVDYNIRVRVAADGSGVDLANARMSMNPFDEIALEEAVRLKEAGLAREIVAVSVGPAESQETLRTALAIGADRAILVDTQAGLEPLIVAKILRALCERELPQLVLCGKQAIDDDAHQTGQMLAALMDWGQATCASQIRIWRDGAHWEAEVQREVDGGSETVALQLPAVITSDLRLNEPRYTTLPGLMQAKKKPLHRLTPDDLGVGLDTRLKTLHFAEPPMRSGALRMTGVDDLVCRLRAQGVV